MFEKIRSFVFLIIVITSAIFVLESPSIPANALVTSVPVGTNPMVLTFNPSNNYMYVLNSHGPISVISGTTNIATITDVNNLGSFGGGNMVLAFNPSNNYMYVSNRDIGTVSVISGTTNIANVTVGKFPQGMAFNPFNNYMYVANGLDGTVSVISGTTNIANVTVGAGGGNSVPIDMVFNPSNNYMYVINSASSTVSVISDITNIATLPVGSTPKAVAFNPSNNDVYVASSGGTVSVISGTTKIATLPVGGYAFAFNPSNNYMYLASPYSSTVSVISGTTIIATVTYGSGASALAFNPYNNDIYVAAGGTVSIISGTTNIATLPVGIAPSAFAFNPYNNYMYVANTNSNTVSVIDNTLTVNSTQNVSNQTAQNNSNQTAPIPQDTTPPVIVPPPNQVITTTSSSGITVHYPAPTATDNVGISSGPSCNPSSGATFPVGVITVICTASDAAGNVGQATFTVTVQLQLTTAENSTQNNSSQITQSTMTQSNPTQTTPLTVPSQPTPTTSQPTTSISNATPQELASIDEAKNSQTIAAEVNVANQAVQTTSIDNNVSVLTDSPTTDSFYMTVSAPSETGPKVIVVNFAATTINVANLKDLGVTYDGMPILPASDIDSILHAKSTDSPSFAIVITQSGAQILISVPHFSSHAITITNLSKVIPAVPEFGSLAGMIIVISIIGVIVISTRFKFIQKV